MWIDFCPEAEDCDVGVLDRAGYDVLTIVGGRSMEVRRTLYEEEKWCGGYWSYRLCS
jgi:hypothetical protein